MESQVPLEHAWFEASKEGGAPSLPCRRTPKDPGTLGRPATERQIPPAVTQPLFVRDSDPTLEPDARDDHDRYRP